MFRLTCALVLLLGLGAFADNSHESDVGSGRATKSTTCPCGSANKKGRIVGGTLALPNEYPWAVTVVIRNYYDAICGAAIVTNKVAITAAHCTHPLPRNTQLNIIAGTSDINRPGQVVPVSNWIEHEAFYSDPKDSSTMVNDIALLNLERPLQFNVNVTPVCMPTGMYNIDNQFVKLVGWGKTSNVSTTVKQLRETDVKKLPFSMCQNFAPLKLPQTQFCTFWPGRGACMGDSGGPVTYLDPETNRYTLIGVVSFGNTECNPNRPTIMTDVAAFLPWIRAKINSLKGYYERTGVPQEVLTRCHDKIVLFIKRKNVPHT